MEIEGRLQGVRWRWSLLISLILLNVFLPSLVLSYGVLLVRAVEFGTPTWLGLFAPILLILTYGLSQCWFREAADSWGESLGHRFLASLGLILVVLGLFLSAFVPYYVQPYVYGILGGLGSSLISAQVDAVVFDAYDTNLGIVRGLCFFGQAAGQSLFPHIISALIEWYGYPLFYIVFAGLMLQTLPAMLFLKVDISRRPISYTRYSDLAKADSVFNNDNFFNELQLNDLGNKSWKSPSDDKSGSEEDFSFDNESIMETCTPPPTPEEKRRNMFGVEIMPDIPEESENSSDDDQIQFSFNTTKRRLSNAIRRLSCIGDNFDDCLSHQTRKGSLSDRELSEPREYSDVEVTYENVAPREVERERVFNSFSFRCQSAYASMRRRMLMPSYRWYRIRKRSIYFMYNINDTFIKPLTRSLSSWRFYPTLLLSFSKLGLTAVSLVLFPTIATLVKPKISNSETNFLLTLHGFTWVCFLLSTPWLVQTPKRNIKYVTILGLLISSAACFLMALADSHDGFSVGCVVAGLGHGAITSCWESTAQHFVGLRKWPKFQSTLEILSASMLAGFFIGITFVVELENGLHLTMFILGVILAVITFIWMILALIDVYNCCIKSKIVRCKWFV